MRYRWVRTLADSGWKTTMTVLSVSPDTVQTSKGPQALSRKVPVSRIEIGDERTPARVFDTDGRMIFMLPTAPSAPATLAGEHPLPDALERVRTAAASFKSSLARDATAGIAVTRPPADPRSREWIEQLMPSAAGRAQRHAALARDMGAVRGGVRGLDRFVHDSDDTTTEVLSDPTWSVPVEINVVRGGTLVSHSVLSYDTDPGAGLVRRRIRSEQLLSPESGDRAVVDVELSNIRLGRGAVR